MDLFPFSLLWVEVNEVWGVQIENGFLTRLNAQPVSNYYVYIVPTIFLVYLDGFVPRLDGV